MKFTLTATTLAAALMLGACATTENPPPAELVRARDAVRMAETDSVVLANAPLDLKRATEQLARANQLNAEGKNLADIATAAYVAQKSAETALEVARAKRQEEAMRAAALERERTRADIQTAEARRAQETAMAAQMRAQAAGARAANAERRASSAETQAMAAQGDAEAARLAAAQSQQQAALSQQQAAALQQQLDQIKATQTERGMLVTLGDVLFEFNRAEVKPTARAELTKVAEFLRQHPDRRIRVEGYTDNVGSADYNLDLSRRRAEAVAAALVSLGVPADRVQTVGHGKDYPVADNGTDTNRAMNRRVEVYISNTDQPVQPRRG